MEKPFLLDDQDGWSLWLTTVEAKSRRALSRAVQELDRGHIPTNSPYDCTGKLCGQYATLHRAYQRHDKTWVGIVTVQQTLDV